jgi:hypothetical protein
MASGFVCIQAGELIELKLGVLLGSELLQQGGLADGGTEIHHPGKSP